VIVRPFNNYGPRQHPEKVIPRFITQALQDLPLTVHGDGHASRDWLYVDDTAEAIEAIIAAPREQVSGEVLNVATGVDISAYRIVQEALTNALRHGDTMHPVTLDFAWTDKEVTVTISNMLRSGAVQRPGGHGLAGLRERAHLAGGSVTAGPVGHSWIVTTRLGVAA
jgi:nucleoside-diphosphate-sugar epimerase